MLSSKQRDEVRILMEKAHDYLWQGHVPDTFGSSLTTGTTINEVGSALEWQKEAVAKDRKENRCPPVVGAQMSKELSQYKPYHDVFSNVVANWTQEDNCNWMEGYVIAYQLVSTGDEYGDVRTYDIRFDNKKNEPHIVYGISEVWVESREDYLWQSKCLPEFWLGVKRVTKICDDDFIQKRGYYEVGMDEGVPYNSLVDALRAHDAALLRQHGNEIRRAQLNFPEEFEMARRSSEISDSESSTQYHVDMDTLTEVGSSANNQARDGAHVGRIPEGTSAGKKTETEATSSSLDNEESKDDNECMDDEDYVESGEESSGEPSCANSVVGSGATRPTRVSNENNQTRLPRELQELAEVSASCYGNCDTDIDSTSTDPRVNWMAVYKKAPPSLMKYLDNKTSRRGYGATRSKKSACIPTRHKKAFVAYYRQLIERSSSAENEDGGAQIAMEGSSHATKTTNGLPKVVPPEASSLEQIGADHDENTRQERKNQDSEEPAARPSDLMRCLRRELVEIAQLSSAFRPGARGMEAATMWKEVYANASPTTQSYMDSKSPNRDFHSLKNKLNKIAPTEVKDAFVALRKHFHAMQQNETSTRTKQTSSFPSVASRASQETSSSPADTSGLSSKGLSKSKPSNTSRVQVMKGSDRSLRKHRNSDREVARSSLKLGTDSISASDPNGSPTMSKKRGSPSLLDNERQRGRQKVAVDESVASHESMGEVDESNMSAKSGDYGSSVPALTAWHKTKHRRCSKAYEEEAEKRWQEFGKELEKLWSDQNRPWRYLQADHTSRWGKLVETETDELDLTIALISKSRDTILVPSGDEDELDSQLREYCSKRLDVHLNLQKVRLKGIVDWLKEQEEDFSNQKPSVQLEQWPQFFKTVDLTYSEFRTMELSALNERLQAYDQLFEEGVGTLASISPTALEPH
uniref:Uncharacterized protein n=1 Tax=Grammatophora oceanica TaxID=210454 RepID=A0A7S1VE84_9STRA|mmetsp:Transcript_44276/g.65691  ORF Transcript_44276/g.65691 Transcript_44276/m.65691 type:complete len:921 (+) Transcript_44276:1652-4414(+)